MHNFNLLPWREMRQKKHLKSMLLDVVFVVFIGIIINFVWVIVASKGLSNQYGRNDYLKVQNTKFLKANVEIVKLENEKMELVRKIELLNNLEKERQRILNAWFEVSKTIPKNVYLVSVEKNKHEIILEGRANNSKEIAQFMRALEDSDVFDRPVLSHIGLSANPDSGGENTFKISVTQEETK